MLLAMTSLLAAGFSLPTPDRPPSDALLRVRLANFDISATEEWLRRRSFAAVLPIQPMLMKPLEEPYIDAVLTRDLMCGPMLMLISCSSPLVRTGSAVWSSRSGESRILKKAEWMADYALFCRTSRRAATMPTTTDRRAPAVSS